MTGLFIGAGASYEVGMPLANELSNTISQNVLKRLDTKLFNFDRVPHLKIILAKFLQNKNLNYEMVLTELEKIYYAERNQPQNVWGVVVQFIECIQLLLLEDQKNILPLFKRKVGDYKGIKTLVQNNAPLNVFSLNHDIVFEELCSYHSVPLRDGFFERNHDYKNTARFKILTREELKKGALNFYKKEEFGVNLLKLHGSIDMFSTNDGKTFLKSCGDGIKFGSHFEQIEKIEFCNLSIAKAERLRVINELGIYDDRNELQFLRRSLLSGGHKFKNQSHQIAPLEFLSAFQQKLGEIGELVVIGYGFGDNHINDIFCAWLSKGGRKMTIYDPYRKNAPLSFKGYLNKIEIVNAGLTDYLSRFDAPTVLLEQITRNKLREKRLLIEPSERKQVAS